MKMDTEPTPQAQPATPPQGADLLDWVVGQYLGQKIQAKNILNYNGANMAYNHARDIAQKLNLDVDKITPFPANSTSINVSVPPTTESRTVTETTTNTGMKPWQQAAVAALLVASGAGAATLMPTLINKPEANDEAVPIAEPFTPTPGTVDIDVR